MKISLIPIISTAILVDALTHSPIQYPDAASIAPTPAATISPITPAQSYDENLNSTDFDDSKSVASLEPSDYVSFTIDQNLNNEPTQTKSINEEQTPNVENNQTSAPSDVNENNEIGEATKIEPTSTQLTKEETTPDSRVSDDDDDDDDDDDRVESVSTEFPDGPTITESGDFETRTTVGYTTSTVYSIVTSTVTDCASTVTYCPESGSVVTKTISLYTTVCPVTTPTSTVPSIEDSNPSEEDVPKQETSQEESSEDEITEQDTPEQDDLEDDSSEGNLPDTVSSGPASPEITSAAYLTKTIETTVWYTVTDCPPQETDCSNIIETSSVISYTKLYPITQDLPRQTSDLGPSKPHVSGSPSGYPILPETNVTKSARPHFTFDSMGSAQRADGFLMCSGLFAATLIALLSFWF